MTEFIVNQSTDNGLGNISGTLSWAIRQANTVSGNDTITLNTDVQIQGVMKTLLNSNIAIVGNGYTVSGDKDGDNDGDFRPFFVKSGTVTLSNLTIADGLAQGGNSGFGGGGAGMGGGLFVYSGNVTLTDVTFDNNQAIGGSSAIGGLGNGGGGMYGNAGASGGGGLFASSTNDDGAYGGLGHYSGGGFGGGGNYAYGETGGDGDHSGGFGGGGGYGYYYGGASGTGFGFGGNGGFGGGGGLGYGKGGFGGAGFGGAGGYGGGGGGGYGFGYGYAGYGGGRGRSGDGSGNGFGGGGAGMGGAIFIRSGSLALTGGSFTSNSAAGGIGAYNGKGFGGAIFAMRQTTNQNASNQGMPTVLPTVALTGVTFANNSATDGGSAATPETLTPGSVINNQDLFGDEIELLPLPIVTLLSLTRQTPAAESTDADTLVFRATFDQDVQNVDATDFVVTGTTATITTVNQVDAATYDITLSGGNLADLNGIVGLNLSATQNIQDLTGNALTTEEPATDETYVVFNGTVPTTGNNSVSLDEDSVYAFNSVDFPYTGGEIPVLQGIRITQLPIPGQLFIDTDGDDIQDVGEAVGLNQEITSTDLTTLKFAPEAEANGSDYASFQFQVSNGFIYSDPATMTLSVTAVSDAPIIENAIADQNATQDSLFSYQVPPNTFADVDGDSLTYSATLADDSDLPEWLNFNSTTQTFSGTPTNDAVGTLSVKVTASDETASISDTFDLLVSNVNDAPTGSVTISGTARQGKALTVLHTLADVDGLGQITYTWLANGTTTGITGDAYHLTQADVGKVFTVEATYVDGHGTTESVTSDPTAAVSAGNAMVFTFEQYVKYQALDDGIQPAFDEEMYLLAHPDIKAAVSSGWFINGAQHYQLYGRAEGRSVLPLNLEVGGIKLSALFDETDYLGRNPDVANLVTQGILSSGFKHFVLYGLAEGRSPSAYYNEGYYRSQNPDVDAAVKGGFISSGLVHYLNWGHQENRVASKYFDPDDYLLQNPDAQAAVDTGTIASAFEHLVEVGDAEGSFSMRLFEESYYLTQNPDVAGVVAAGLLPTGFEHYISYGQQEGRSPSALFSESAYLSANPDVAVIVQQGWLSSGMEHYYRYGRAEQRPLG